MMFTYVLPQLKAHMAKCDVKDTHGHPCFLVPDFSRGFYSVLLKGLEAVLDERDALTARVEELEKALKPFADAWGKMPTEAHPNEHCRFYNYTVCTLGDLRRAAAAMEGKK